MNHARSVTFFRVRVGVLLCILAAVGLWAWHDVRARRGRKTWDHSLHIAVVLLRVAPVDEEYFAAIREKAAVFEQRLDGEMRRYRPRAPRPFVLTVLGPVNVAAPPPAPDGDGLIDLARLSWASWRYVRAVDEAGGVDSGFDSRIYVVVGASSSADRSFVDGHSEQDGRIGTVTIEMNADPTSADFAWIVVAHELFHTLGATDRYDERGRTLVPLGLAEPALVPVFPQKYLEVMARNVPLSATEERPPENLDELAVGPTTAREIGWIGP